MVKWIYKTFVLQLDIKGKKDNAQLLVFFSFFDKQLLVLLKGNTIHEVRLQSKVGIRKIISFSGLLDYDK